MQVLTTTTQIDPVTQRFFNRTLLWGAYPALCYERFAQMADIPDGEGDTILWRRYNALAVATTPLTEGVDPAGKQLSKTDLTAQIQQYGDFVVITEKVNIMNREKIFTVAAKKQSRQAGRTKDQITRDYLAACASSTNADGGSNGDTPTEVTASDVEGVVETLLGNDAQFLTEIMAGQAKEGTAPVDASFFGIIDTDVMVDFKGCSGWQKVSEYPDPKRAAKDEVGCLDYVRFLMTSAGYYSNDASSLSADIFYTMIFGEDAYGSVKLGGRNLQNVVHGFNEAGSVLNLRATSGWKFWTVTRILNDNYMHILKHTKGAR